MFFRFYSVLLLILCSARFMHVLGQKPGQKKVDSLVSGLGFVKEDTTGVLFFNTLSRAYQHLSPDSGIYYGNKALTLAQNINYTKGIAWANFYIGRNYYNLVMNNYFNPQNINPKENYIKTWQYFIEAERLFELVGDNDGRAAALSAISGAYFNQGDYERCLEYDMKALKIYERIGDKVELFKILGGIANDYRMLKRYEQSYTYYTKAIEIAKEVNETNRIIGFYRNIGDVFIDSANYPLALQYYLSTLEMAKSQIADSNLFKMFAGVVYADISDVHSLLGNYAMSLQYARQALQSNITVGEKNRISNMLASIGDIYLQWAQLSEALYNTNIHEAEKLSLTLPRTRDLMIDESVLLFNQSVHYAENINNYSIMQHSYQKLYEAYKLKGNTLKALQSYEHYNAIKDSVYIKEEKEKLLKQQMQYELDKIIILTKAEHDKKIALTQKQLHEEKNMRYASTGIALLLLVIASISISAYRQKQKNNEIISAEKQRSEDLLLNILPSEIAEELKINGSSKAKHFNDVTVMFTDFVNFTKAGERMTPEDLVNELDTCFKAFDDIIDKHGIEKIKTIGDAYLAVSGLPQKNSDHAINMVAAGRDIIAYMKARKEIMGDGTFHIRVGIHSGEVVAGIVGVKKFAYDVWGDTVNTAARMEQSSEPGKINISESTYQLINHKYACTYRGEITARNKGAMNMYFVDGELSVTNQA